MRENVLLLLVYQINNTKGKGMTYSISQNYVIYSHIFMEKNIYIPICKPRNIPLDLNHLFSCYLRSSKHRPGYKIHMLIQLYNQN